MKIFLFKAKKSLNKHTFIVNSKSLYRLRFNIKITGFTSLLLIFPNIIQNRLSFCQFTMPSIKLLSFKKRFSNITIKM